MYPGKHQSSKQRGQDEGWKVQEGAHLLFFTHTLCTSYIITMFLLVSCMNTRNHLLYFARFCALSTPQKTNKNLQQRTLPSFITISLYLPCHDQGTTLLCSWTRFFTTLIGPSPPRCIDHDLG